MHYYLRGFDDTYAQLGFSKEADAVSNYYRQLDPQGYQYYTELKRIDPRNTDPTVLKKKRDLTKKLRSRPSFQGAEKLRGMKAENARARATGNLAAQGVPGSAGGPGTPQQWAEQMAQTPEGRARLTQLRNKARHGTMDPNLAAEAAYAKANPEEYAYQRQKTDSPRAARRGKKPQPASPKIPKSMPQAAPTTHAVGGTGASIVQPPTPAAPKPGLLAGVKEKATGLLSKAQGGLKKLKPSPRLGGKAGLIGAGLLAAGGLASAAGAFDKKKQQIPQQYYGGYGGGYGY